VENSPKGKDVYALIQDPNDTNLDWHAYGENPGNRHPISAITNIDIDHVSKNEDISWNDIYEDYKLIPDEEFFISKELVPPDATGYKFILEYKTGEKILEVDILPAEPKNNNELNNGELSDLAFKIQVLDNEISDGEFSISCTLKNVGNTIFNISSAGLGFPTLNFYIETPEDKTVHYFGPYVETKATGIELGPGKMHNWNTTIKNEFQNWGEEGDDYDKATYQFHTGDYKVYGNYTSKPSYSWDKTVISGWKLSDVISFTLV
jgi:hypothetical protein